MKLSGISLIILLFRGIYSLIIDDVITIITVLAKQQNFYY